MAKPRGRYPRSGRATAPGARSRPHLRVVPDDEPDLLAEVHRALRSDVPLDLLVGASALLAAVDPRAQSPFPAARERAALPSLDDVLESFVRVEQVETSALLAVIAEVGLPPGDPRRTGIGAELAERAHALPEWLSRIDEVEVYRAVEMAHVLGDGDNVMLAMRFHGGRELSIVVHVDHNLGTLVKDAFVVPQQLDQLVTFMRREFDDPDMAWREIDLADAAVRVTEAVELGALSFPPFRTETWPACRPLVEWACRKLPAGGRGYERPEWSETAKAALADHFLASPFGADLDEGHRDLLDSVLWFGTDYGPGDPLRWSAVAVEMLLADWLPRTVIADPELLAKAPELLRAFIRYCHDERGLRGPLTDETLGAVDHYEPLFRDLIGRDRAPVVDELCVFPALDVLDHDLTTRALGRLRRAVGGDEALQSVDDAALPDEPFDWEDIPGDVHPAVRRVLALCDECCDRRLDREYRTACRRFLHAVAAGDPGVFRRRAKAETAAAAICWIVGHANELFLVGEGKRVQVKDLMAWFGLKPAAFYQRAGTLLRAAGGERDEDDGEVVLGSPAYLVSTRRRVIARERDRHQDRD
jgi:hypothetical protein